MGLAMEIINTFVTNPGAGPVATAAVGGDTFAVKNFDPPNNAWLADVWAAAATPGIVRVRSPRLHDNVQGLRFNSGPASTPRSLLTEWVRQKLYPQDALIPEMGGGGAESDGMAWLVMYEDLPGSAARLANLDAIAPRIVNLVNVEVVNAAAAAIGAYSVSRAINTDFDLLIANTDYAVLGYESSATGLSVGLRGPDTGNLRLGGPMTTERIETRDWFADLNRKLGVPTIPIINSANKAATFVDNAQVVVGVAATITLVMAQLAP